MASTSNTSVQEFAIRVPKNVPRKHHVMRFNGKLRVDFDKWSQVKMERENNMREFKGLDEEQPKYGAGSEFGREAKEEARRKKLGIITKRYRPDAQPWILKSYGKTVQKFKGIREGGVADNTAYYVFTHAEDGAIEAFPLHEWYQFQSIERYKALSAEEAELEFSKRNKSLNYFSLMFRKRLKGEEDAESDGEEKDKVKKTSKKVKDLKISEMDEWIDSSEAESDSDEEKKDKEKEDDDDGGNKDKKKKGKNAKAKPKKKRDTSLEALEDSDDGDEEGRELDYISDSSASGPENLELDGVAEEKGLKKLLNSDEEESEDSDKEEKDKNEEEKETDENDKKAEDDKDKKKKKKDKKKDIKKKKDNDPDDDFSSDSTSDEDLKKKKGDKKEKGKKDDKGTPESASSSRSASPTVDNKRKLVNDAMTAGPSKKPKLELNHIPGLADSGLSLEDAVRKYLIRKPLTTTELLQKIKSKKTGLSSDQLVYIMTQILKKLNPVKQTFKGKMYLSLPKA